MDPFKFTTIAHRDHTFCSPLSSAKVDQVLAMLDLPANASVIDAGCGKAEMLIRLAERHTISGVGVDTNPHFLAEARQHAAARVPDADLGLHQADMQHFPAAPHSFAAAICVGSTHAFGGYREALRSLAGLVSDGGQVLVGEGYWKQDPDPAYLAFLGAEAGDYLTHGSNISAGVDAGLTPLYAVVSSQDEWDHYEGLYNRAVQLYVASHPEDADSEAMKYRIDRWRDAYYRWGRDTLGFGLYLFRK